MMMKQALGTAVAAVFATAIVGAQEPAQSQQEQRDYQAGQQMLTVEGCLQEDASAQVAAAARDDDKAFLLVNAEVQPATPGEAPVGTTGEPGAQPETPIGTAGAADAAAMSATKFKVAGLDEERLAQHEGQRVRIQGRIEHSEHRGTAPESDRPTADPTGAPESPTATAAADEAPKLKATSIQAVAGTCPDASESR